MSTDSVYRASARLEEKGLLKVLQRGEGRSPSRYQLLRSGRNLRPQESESDSWSQSAATSNTASGRNLRPQNALSPQSATTTEALIEGTRPGAHARVGGLVGTTTPTHPPTSTDRARADAAPIDDDAFEFMASLPLKRTPRIAEQREISDLFTAKISAGFTVTEIRDSAGGDWDGVRDRVRVLISRLKELPDRPLRRPDTNRPTAKPRPECADCGRPIDGEVKPDGLCVECRADAADRAAAEKAYQDARHGIKAEGPNDRANAEGQARAEGLTDPRAIALRAAEILGDLNRLSYRQDPDEGP